MFRETILAHIPTLKQIINATMFLNITSLFVKYFLIWLCVRIKIENTKKQSDYYLDHPEWITEGIELSKKSISGTLKTLEEVREYFYPTLKEGGFVSTPSE